MSLIFINGPASSQTVNSFNRGRATVSMNWDIEGIVSVTGQTFLALTSSIAVSIVNDTEDVYAQDWVAPTVQNEVAGVGFDIVIRPAVGTFKGNVTVSWLWQ